MIAPFAARQQRFEQVDEGGFFADHLPDVVGMAVDLQRQSLLFVTVDHGTMVLFRHMDARGVFGELQRYLLADFTSLKWLIGLALLGTCRTEDRGVD
jgi:hypothetical protein